MDDNQNRENQKQCIISEPDEKGVRYYTIDRSAADQPPDPAGLSKEGTLQERALQELREAAAPASVSQQDAAQENQHRAGIGTAGDGEPHKVGGGFQKPPRGSGIPPGNVSMPPTGRKSFRKKPLIIFGCVLLAVILLGVACSSLTSGSDEDFSSISEDHISILYIDGTIGATDDSTYTTDGYDHEWTMQRLDDVIDNPNNKGLILFVNTPGGSVYETDELYLKLQEYKATGRPLYSAMGSMAASGGYYISAPADKIIANRNCWTGSIGVTIGTIFDISKLLDRYGVKTVTITSGKNKAMGSMTDPLTKEQQEIYQSLVDEAYEQFVEIVAEGRNMSIRQVKKLADGRIYTAKQAQENGLIDQIGTLEEAVSDMRTQYRLDDCSVYDMKYENSSLFASLLGKMAQMVDSQQKSSDVAALLELMEQQGNVPISYMAQIGK